MSPAATGGAGQGPRSDGSERVSAETTRPRGRRIRPGIGLLHPEWVEAMRESERTDNGVFLPYDIHRRPLSMTGRVMAAAFAPALTVTMLNPLSTVRVRMQLDGKEGQPKIYSGPLDCFRQIYRKEGWRGLQ